MRGYEILALHWDTIALRCALQVSGDSKNAHHNSSSIAAAVILVYELVPADKRPAVVSQQQYSQKPTGVQAQLAATRALRSPCVVKKTAVHALLSAPRSQRRVFRRDGLALLAYRFVGFKIEFFQNYTEPSKYCSCIAQIKKRQSPGKPGSLNVGDVG